ncbi:uncharacterized protein [Cicer arietinum]|uniref:uncharacterized protein n=1 Tax=Cicer arietinum TaxID=3827 RepID=UPI003CC63DF6
MTDRVIIVELRLESGFVSLRETVIVEIHNEIRSASVQATPEHNVETIAPSFDEFRLFVKKVELPYFNGEDHVAWITRAETYFEVQRIFETDRIQLTKLKLKDLKQQGYVEEYVVEFELYSSQCRRLPEQQFLGYFVGGLYHDIRSHVHTFKPKSRCQAMPLARDVENEFTALTQSGHTQGVRHRSGRTQLGVRHLHVSYIHEKWANELCFRCNERWHPLHQCAGKHLRLVILGDDETINDDGEIVVVEVVSEEEKHLKDLECKAMGYFELHSVNGFHACTMKFEGFVNGVSVLVLIDSGATHNFVTPTVVEAWVYQCGVVGNVGKVTMDWKEISMVFNHGGHSVQLQGLSAKGRATTLQSVIKNDREANGGGWSTSMEHGAGLVSVRPYRYPHYQTNEINKQINTLLQQGKCERGAWTPWIDMLLSQIHCLARPLTELTKKEGFVWNAAAETAFEQFKVAVTSAPVLALPNFELPFEIECDAAGKGVSDVLMHLKHPIAYFRKDFSGNKLSKSAYEKELMAIVLAIQHWRHYLLVYKVGVESKASNALSRQHEDCEVKLMLSYPIWNQGGQLQQEVKKLLKEFHYSSNGGHLGFLRTYRRMEGMLYWHGMMKRVQEFVKACDTCQCQKYASTTPSSGLLQPLPIPVLVWSEILMDFITSMPKSNGYEAILVVVDQLPKYSHFITLKHLFIACSIATIFVKEVIRLHGVLESILSDRDPLFVSIFWNELFKLLGTVLKMSSAYHRQTGEQTEVINCCLEAYMRCFVADQPKKPPVLVHYLEGETRVEAVALEFKDQDEALRQLKYNLTKAQEYMKYYVDKKRKDVIQRVREVSYKLQLLKNSKINPIFHVSQLPLNLEVDKREIMPENIMSWRDEFEGGQHRRKLFVQWKGIHVDKATWDDELLLKSQFPDLSLEDKAVFDGGGNEWPNSNEGDVLVGVNHAKPKIWRVYERKKKREKE